MRLPCRLTPTRPRSPSALPVREANRCRQTTSRQRHPRARGSHARPPPSLSLTPCFLPSFFPSFLPRLSVGSDLEQLFGVEDLDDDDDVYVPSPTRSPVPVSPLAHESIALRTRAHADLTELDLDEWAERYQDILDRADQEEVVTGRRRAPQLPPTSPLQEDSSELYSEVVGGPAEADELLPFAALLGMELPDDENDEEYAPPPADEDEEEYRDDSTTKVSSQSAQPPHSCAPSRCRLHSSTGADARLFDRTCAPHRGGIATAKGRVDPYRSVNFPALRSAGAVVGERSCPHSARPSALLCAGADEDDPPSTAQATSACAELPRLPPPAARVPLLCDAVLDVHARAGCSARALTCHGAHDGRAGALQPNLSGFRPPLCAPPSPI